MPMPRISDGPVVPAPLGASFTGAADPAAHGPVRSTQEPVRLPATDADPRRPRRSFKGLLIAVLALSVTAGILFAPSIPSWDGMGAAWTSFLPWTAVLLVLLAAIAAVRRAWWGLSAVIVSLMVWSVVFVPQLMPAKAAGAAELTVATQNIGAANTDPVASASTLATVAPESSRSRRSSRPPPARRQCWTPPMPTTRGSAPSGCGRSGRWTSRRSSSWG